MTTGISVSGGVPRTVGPDASSQSSILRGLLDVVRTCFRGMEWFWGRTLGILFGETSLFRGHGSGVRGLALLPPLESVSDAGVPVVAQHGVPPSRLSADMAPSADGGAAVTSSSALPQQPESVSAVDTASSPGGTLPPSKGRELSIKLWRKQGQSRSESSFTIQADKVRDRDGLARGGVNMSLVWFVWNAGTPGGVPRNYGSDSNSIVIEVDVNGERRSCYYWSRAEADAKLGADVVSDILRSNLSPHLDGFPIPGRERRFTSPPGVGPCPNIPGRDFETQRPNPYACIGLPDSAPPEVVERETDGRIAALNQRLAGVNQRIEDGRRRGDTDPLLLWERHGFEFELERLRNIRVCCRRRSHT
ncbi:MAG: hypothetical protein LBB26_01640 [Puniceicoccales bacterium]|nr:hypothetical protein [Puniceicoccales bacterium]